MVFVDDISELEFNDRPNKWANCYHDIVFTPADIILQCLLPQPPASGYMVNVQVTNTAGIPYADQDQTFYNWFVGYASISSNTNTFYYLNLQALRFSDTMLAAGCFCLQITVYTAGTYPNVTGIVFEKFTQAYELGTSCASVSNVIITQNDTHLQVTDCSVLSTNFCGKTYHKFVSYFTCQSQFTGDYYGLPTTILSGNSPAFLFYKITWLEGRLRYIPHNIKRTYSLNCNFQRSETINQYQFKSQDRYSVFPAFKANEIDLMLLSDNLYLDDTQYRYAGDTPFTSADKCNTEYLLVLNLQDCDTYQIFNCTPDCVTTAQLFVFMQPSITGKYYSQNGNLVATNTSELLIYLKSFSQVQSVQDITALAVGLQYIPYKIYRIISQGYVPNFIYSGNPLQVNKVFSQPIAIDNFDLRSYGNGIISSKTCTAPEIGTIYSISVICDAPIIGEIWLTDPITYNLGFINEVNGWTVDNSVSNAQLTENRVTFELSISNPIYTSPTTLVNEEVGIISNQGWPQSLVTITPTNNPNLQPGSMVTIDATGIIRYSGQTTTADMSGATVQLFGLNYNILNVSMFS